ncbi:MAG: LysM peptidoglycan-binding domain-containing protein [Myxococcota bacterium]|nr:LysM peptidoglycan-binding domain-containing protein [Myxococcota bacterium]
MRLYSMLIALGLIFGTAHFAHAESVKTHVVLPGDTLGKIAKKYKLTIAELVEFNPQLEDPNALEVGMSLQLEAAPVAAPEAPAEPEEAPAAEAKTEDTPAAEAKTEEAPAAAQETGEDAQSASDEAPAEEDTTTQSAEGDEPLPDLVDLPSAEETETPTPEDVEGTQDVATEAAPSLSLNESAENEVIADPRGIRAALGMIYMQRWGLLRAKSGIQNPPTYFGGIPGFLLQVELYPQLMFPFLEGDAAMWLEKLGFRLESHFASVGTPSELSKKNHMAGAWSATTFYRYQFWQGAMAPEIAGGLGYTHFRHPMEDEAYFPGSRYNALSINGTLDLPLAIGFKIPFIRKLMATGTVTYYPWVGASGKLKRLGKKDGSIAARIEGGGHITLDLEELDPIFRNMPVILRMLLRAEYFGTNYKGETSLPTSSQFTDTSLHDMMVGIHITAGILY